MSKLLKIVAEINLKKKNINKNERKVFNILIVTRFHKRIKYLTDNNLQTILKYYLTYSYLPKDRRDKKKALSHSVYNHNHNDNT